MIPDLDDDLGLATIGYEGKITGVDDEGVESVFTASLGFDGLSNAAFTFGELATPTISGLLGQVFIELLAGLPPNLQANLSLDLTTASILFALPPNQTNYFAQNFASDVTVESIVGIQQEVPIPEPTTLTLVSIRSFAALLRYKRRAGRGASLTRTTIVSRNS